MPFVDLHAGPGDHVDGRLDPEADHGEVALDPAAGLEVTTRSTRVVALERRDPVAEERLDPVLAMDAGDDLADLARRAPVRAARETARPPSPRAPAPGAVAATSEPMNPMPTTTAAAAVAGVRADPLGVARPCAGRARRQLEPGDRAGAGCARRWPRRSCREREPPPSASSTSRRGGSIRVAVDAQPQLDAVLVPEDASGRTSDFSNGVSPRR